MNSFEEKLYLFGAGGHSKVIIDTAKKQNIQVSGVFDDDTCKVGSLINEVPIIGGRQELVSTIKDHNGANLLVSIGDNHARRETSSWLSNCGLPLASLTHEFSCLSDNIVLGCGSVVLAGAIIQTNVTTGRGVIINSRSLIEHDCVLGDYVHVSPGAVICGSVAIGDCSWVGAGSTVIPGVKIGKNCVIAAGSVVTKDVPNNLLVAGNPAKIKRPVN